MRYILATLLVGAFLMIGGAFLASTGSAQPIAQEMATNVSVSLDRVGPSITLLGCC